MLDGLLRISGVEEGDKNKGGKEDRSVLKNLLPEAGASRRAVKGLPLPPSHGAPEDHQTQREDSATARKCGFVWQRPLLPYVGSLRGGQCPLKWEAEWMRVCPLWKNPE